jgi:hypothetical protein
VRSSDTPNHRIVRKARDRAYGTPRPWRRARRSVSRRGQRGHVVAGQYNIARGMPDATCPRGVERAAKHARRRVACNAQHGRLRCNVPSGTPHGTPRGTSVVLLLGRCFIRSVQDVPHDGVGEPHRPDQAAVRASRCRAHIGSCVLHAGVAGTPKSRSGAPTGSGWSRCSGSSRTVTAVTAHSALGERPDDKRA